MKTEIYNVKIKDIGKYACETLEDNYLITFREGAPKDLVDYCFILEQDILTDIIKPGQILELGSYKYEIESVGEIANTNFKELSHLTIKFNSDSSEILPGSIHVLGAIPISLSIGDSIIIYNK